MTAAITITGIKRDARHGYMLSVQGQGPRDTRSGHEHLRPVYDRPVPSRVNARVMRLAQGSDIDVALHDVHGGWALDFTPALVIKPCYECESDGVDCGCGWLDAADALGFDRVDVFPVWPVPEMAEVEA